MDILKPTPETESSLETTERRFQQAFGPYARLVEQSLPGALPAPEEFSAPVVEAMRYSLLSPAKRVRPVLTLVSALLAGGKAVKVLDAACAVEMIHTASLILDDLPCMDDASLRRGKPPLHVQAGEATAILAANALLMQAFHLLGRSVEAHGLRSAAAGALIRDAADCVGAPGMIGGQWKDLHLDREDLESLEFVHSRKTGALFILSATLGARLCRARAGVVDPLAAYAKNLGLAYQVVDDILETDPAAPELGKQAASDGTRKTFVSVFGLEASRVIASELLDTARAALARFKGPEAQLLLDLADYVLERKV